MSNRLPPVPSHLTGELALYLRNVVQRLNNESFVSQTGMTNTFAIVQPDAGGTVLLSASTVQLSATSNLLGSASVVSFTASGGTTYVRPALVVDQGALDSNIMELRSSDVAHGMTTLADTSSYLFVKKTTAADGVGQVHGLGEGLRALDLFGTVTTGDTSKTASSDAAVVVDGSKKSGTGSGSLGAAENILILRNNGAAKFIFDADGSSYEHTGVAWTNFDDHDDIALLNQLSAYVTAPDDPLRDTFAAWLTQSREALERLRLVAFDQDGSPWVNMSRLAMLHTGALRQLGARLERLEQHVLPSAT